jgi:hypothetical protein
MLSLTCFAFLLPLASQQFLSSLFPAKIACTYQYISVSDVLAPKVSIRLCKKNSYKELQEMAFIDTCNFLESQVRDATPHCRGTFFFNQNCMKLSFQQIWWSW